MSLNLSDFERYALWGVAGLALAGSVYMMATNHPDTAKTLETIAVNMETEAQKLQAAGETSAAVAVSAAATAISNTAVASSTVPVSSSDPVGVSAVSATTK